ncbi:MAG TPA: patatin-like phospholipase family protein [Dehalococcoidia bacterium]|nr:patatin-like phospholipase family protein [Dehalococcoidia bacterium]
MRKLKLGLALGAGGTKGAAHVGVLKVLEDAGIPIDMVAGTSIGALYGGAYAAGHTVHEMDDGIRNQPPADVVNFFRHRLKIRHNNRLALRFYQALAGHHIEQLPIPFAATASDIVAHRSVTITTGPLIDAIEASIAIPLIARPVAHQGRYLLDGGFWDCAPVDAALQLGADIVVAVELGEPYLLPPQLRAPATWLAGKMRDVPLGRTLAGLPFTIDAVAHELPPPPRAHIVIRPGVQRLRGNSPFHMVRSIDAGADAAREALPLIRAALAGQPLPMPEAQPRQGRRFTVDPGLA